MSKLKIEEMAKAINYENVEPYFFDDNGKEYHFTIGRFKEFGRGFSKVVFECSDFEENKTTYTMYEKEGAIVIDSDEFTIKEFIIIVNMIDEHLRASRACDFVAFGNADEDTHKLFHEESTVFGCWWKDFHKLYTDRLASDKKISQIQILTLDYDTDDKRMYVKDRVISIVLF